MNLRMKALVMFAILVGSAGAALAQDQPAEPRKKFSSLINVDALIDNYGRFLARKYELTDEQANFTNQLLHAKSQEFLAHNEPQLRDLVDRLFDVRGGADMSQDEMVNWGKSMTPIYDEAKKMIVSGNDEWRAILTDEQKRMHDEDLRLMKESFASTDEALARISSGDMTLDEFRNPRHQNNQRPNPPPPQATPPADAGGGAGEGAVAPVKQPADMKGQNNPQDVPPDAGGQPVDPGVAPQPNNVPPGPQPAPGKGQVGGAGPVALQESEWAAYVRQFVDRYKLDDAQKQRAYTILQECESQADRLKRKYGPEFERIDKRLTEIRGSTDKGLQKEAADLNARRNKLNEPVGEIFEKQLKPRLEKLPTPAQRKDAEGAKKGGPAVAPAKAGTPAAPAKAGNPPAQPGSGKP